MPVVELTTEEWQAVLAIVSTAPWRDANPLLLKMGEQLRSQAQMAQPAKSADGKETHQ